MGKAVRLIHSLLYFEMPIRVGSYPMHNPQLCSTLLDHIRGLGYHVGRTTYCDFRSGLLMVCLDGGYPRRTRIHHPGLG